MIYHFVNHAFVAHREVAITPFDLGLLRGYGVFDYVQLYQGRPLHLDEHLKRLQWSAEQVDLPLPKSLDELRALTVELIDRNPSINAGIRFLVTGGMCGDELLSPSGQSGLLLLFHPFDPYPQRYYQRGLRAMTVDVKRCYPCVKVTDYTPAILAMKHAHRAAVDEAIYLSAAQELLEATTSNLFFFRKGKWITAPQDQVLNGVTRKILLQLAQPHYAIELRALHIKEVETCQEAFLCSSRKDVIPLVQIDGKPIGNGLPGPCATHMRTLFHTYCQDYFLKYTHRSSKCN